MDKILCKDDSYIQSAWVSIDERMFWKINGLSKYQTHDYTSLYIYARALRYELQFHVNVAMNALAAAFIYASVTDWVKFAKYFKFNSHQRLTNCILAISRYFSLVLQKYCMNLISLSFKLVIWSKGKIIDFFSVKNDFVSSFHVYFLLP